MGISGISIWQLLIIFAILLLLFGGKRLRTLGTDLGSMLKGFRSSMSEGREEADKAEKSSSAGGDAAFEDDVTEKSRDKA